MENHIEQEATGCLATMRLRVWDEEWPLISVPGHGTFELVPASLVPKDQRWLHHPEVRRRVGEAEKDFTAGRSTRTETPEDAQAFLDDLKTRPAPRSTPRSDDERGQADLPVRRVVGTVEEELRPARPGAASCL
jgi:hypothetical protein